jgi:hypothetical protein
MPEEPKEPVGTPKDDSTEGHIEQTSAQKTEAAERELALRAVDAVDPPPKPKDKPDKKDEPAAKPEDNPAYQKLATSYGALEKKMREFEKVTIPGLQATAKEHEDLKAAMSSTDPAVRFAAAEKLGLNFKDWSDHILADPEDPKTDEQKRIDSLEASLKQVTDALSKKDEEGEKLKADQEVAKRKEVARQIVETDEKNRFPFTKLLGASDELLNVAKDMIDAGGSPTNEEVAVEAEKRIVSTLKGQMKILGELPAFREMAKEYGFTHKARAPQENKGDETANGSRTLTNEMSAEPGGELDYSKMTDAEKRTHAMRKSAEVEKNMRELRGA